MIDPKNPARWADGSARSQANAFDWQNWTLQADWSDVIRSAKNSETSADTVERQRADGKKVWPLTVRSPKQTAMVSIENREAGERSRDRLAALRRSAI